MKVKYLDLQEQFKDKALWAAVKKQFELCQFVMGQEVERFESNFSKLCQTRFALGLNSGTDAIFLALKALEIGPGDEVITASNSFVATAGAIVAASARPVFVDVGADYNINPDLIAPAITERTRAIMPVHLTGNPANMPEIIEIANRSGIYILEDAAQAVGASIDGKATGSFGDAGCFSLHPLKNLNVCGDGGVLVTSSREIYEKVKLLRNHGLKNRDEIELLGYNSRLDTIQATVANHVLQNLGSTMEARRRNAQLYDDELISLEDFVTLPPRRTHVLEVFHTYVIQVKKRDKLIAYLNGQGVEAKIHYPIPIHLQKPFRSWGYKEGDFLECEKQCESILSLPIHQHLSEEQLYYVTDLIKTFYE